MADQATEETSVIKAVRSDTLIQYLSGISNVLTSLVNDINTQITTIQSPATQTQGEPSHGHSEEE